MIIQKVKDLSNMIKISEEFAESCTDYFEQMSEMFSTIPTLEKETISSDMIRDLRSIDDEENVKFSDEEVLSSTNLQGSYYKSKRSVTNHE